MWPTIRVDNNNGIDKKNIHSIQVELMDTCGGHSTDQISMFKNGPKFFHKSSESNIDFVFMGSDRFSLYMSCKNGKRVIMKNGNFSQISKNS